MSSEPDDLLTQISPLFKVRRKRSDFVSRSQEEHIINQVIEQAENQAQSIVVLYGLGGYGKTNLAIAICHNPRIKEVFAGDICWIEIGKVEINYRELALKITDRRCLVVLDDLREERELEEFLRAGEFSYCTWLITTQNFNLTSKCQDNYGCQKLHKFYIGKMSQDEAKQLLSYGLPNIEQNKLKSLLARLYEFPLLIYLVRLKINERLDLGNTVDQALDSVTKNLSQFVNFDSSYNQEVWKKLAVFFYLLGEDEQAYFRELFIFQSHVKIPLSTVGRLWNKNLEDVMSLCEKLRQLSLLEQCDWKKNTILINDFLRKYWIEKELKEKLPAIHQKLIQAYNNLPEETNLSAEEETYLYHYLPYHLKKAGEWNDPPPPTSLMHILHLSDLHFGTPDQAILWFNQLAADLYNDRNIPHLDALILSGDIANYSTEEEYKAAEQFLHNLRQDFSLNPEQIILVPGNHDLNWELSEAAYSFVSKRKLPNPLPEGLYIPAGEAGALIRDEAEYKQRFAHFSQFYKTIKQKPYPLDYDQQYTLDHLKEQNLLILGLNSAWQLDHHYKSRASINTNALSNALTQIRRHPDYKNCLKIAVWHHPLDSAYSDRITDQGFLEQLAVNGFRFFLHGHIHNAETSLYRYDMSTNGRKLDGICAGTFGAPVREWVPGYPLQYNLLKFEDNQLTVITRRREELNGAWKPDARWLQGAGKTPLDYYEISLS